MERLGLEAKDGQFFLDGQPTRLFSGAMHYFRTVPDYWEDRLSSLRAAGLNAVETYVPWNLHEECKGQFNFAGILDIRRFIQTAHKVGLFVLLRPGPYICSEWDFGGLPSWLLADPEMQVRSCYEPYLEAVAAYFARLLPLVADLQYSNGGPIIAVQIENEYGSYGDDKGYLTFLKDTFLANGIAELLFTSDGDDEASLMAGHVPGVLMTANFQSLDVGRKLLAVLQNRQPHMPTMVMEFWSGWFDHWGEERHNQWPVEEFEKVFRFILSDYGNFNVYMFHGGTNFGFMNGANEQLRNVKDYQADVTSYDYDALLDESGAPTAKYRKLKELVAPHTSKLIYLPPKATSLQQAAAAAAAALGRPASTDARAYGTIELSRRASLQTLLSLVAPVELEQSVTSMEMLSEFNGGLGQGYGFIVYRKVLPTAGCLTFAGPVGDRAVVYLDGQEVAVIESNVKDATVTLQEPGTLDILVENMGRVNYAPFRSQILNNQRKGLKGPVLLDHVALLQWQVFPLSFKPEFVLQVLQQPSIIEAEDSSKRKTAGLYAGTLVVNDDQPHDTYLLPKGWTKGVVFCNGFNLGRYWSVGPTQTLYIPGPLLVKGNNEIAIFEVHKSSDVIDSIREPLL